MTDDPVRPTIVGPTTWPARNPPPRFAVETAGLPLYAVELAAAPSLMTTVCSRRRDNYYYGGDARNAFATGPSWHVPASAWVHLRRAAILYYRIVVLDHASGSSWLSVDDHRLDALPTVVIESGLPFWPISGWIEAATRRGGAELFDMQARGRLVDALCARYRDYTELEMFLDLRLDRALSAITAPDAFTRVVFRVVKRAEADGWIDHLIVAAAADSPRDTALRELATARERVPSAPVTDAATALDIVLVLPTAAALAEAMRADPRVRAVGCFPDMDEADAAVAGADAVVVSTGVPWTTAQDGPSGSRDLLVVLLEATNPGEGSEGAPTWPAESVVQIVAAKDPREAARRIVDHLATVVPAQDECRTLSSRPSD